MSGLIDGFLKPDNEFSPFPFWFLNGDLKEEKIEKQMRDFASKGIYGVVLHPRVGVPRTLEYLSDAFMQKIVFAVKTAGQLSMKVLLYDEGMYPSGSAHGKVVEENPDYAAKGMRLVKDGDEIHKDERILYTFALQMTSENEYILGSARVLKEGEEAAPFEKVAFLVSGFTLGTIRGIHEDEDDGQKFAPKAGDLLNYDAMQAFIRHTHEVYYQYLSEEFGKTVIGFFTDEPSPTGRASRRGMIPWTDGFDEEMIENGFKPEDFPALFLLCGGNEKRIRAQYERLVNARLVKTYYHPISEWCVAHDIALCGHPHSAQDSLLLTEFQIPGQDIVWRWVAPENDLSLSGEQSAQAKCASDVARHIGARRNLNECFGCCGPKGEMWALNIWDMKWYLNWLFARGCNFIIPHAFFYELDTPIQADRPPDVGPNNIFWDEYAVISDYIKRMCFLNTDSVNQARVAVLGSCDTLEVDGVRKLYESHVEFNYLMDEHFLASEIRDGKIYIKNQAYEALIVPESIAFARGTDEKIMEAEQNGVYVTNKADQWIYSKKSCVFNNRATDIRTSLLKKDGFDVLILTNESEMPYRGRVQVPFNGDCAILNPWTGDVKRLLFKNKDAIIELDGREIKVITNAPVDMKTPIYENSHGKKHRKTLNTKWEMHLPSGAIMQGLHDWQEIEETRIFSGSISYTAKIKVNDPEKEMVLDLGKIHEKVKLFINDREVGVKIAPPYRFDVQGFMKKGRNEIKVVVTNAPVSKYENKPWISGMFGPTFLYIYD
ncbi:MAG: hypothetical protein IJN21_02670 [Clostridia bacterium]|nr:hypothetical protein [Clostridia bacterium]